MQDQAERVAESGELADGLAKLGTQYEADIVRMTQAWRSLPGTAADEAAIYHHLEDPSLKLTPKQEQIYRALEERAARYRRDPRRCVHRVLAVLLRALKKHGWGWRDARSIASVSVPSAVRQNDTEGRSAS